MKAMKQGKLKSGRSGKKVTSPKQAIAIGLSEARKEGKKVPAEEVLVFVALNSNAKQFLRCREDRFAFLFLVGRGCGCCGWSGSWGCRCCRGSAVLAGLRIVAGLRIGAGLGVAAGFAGAVAGGFGFGVAVAVGVPAAAFEADGGGGEDALEMAAAVRADGDLGVGELLDLFGVLVAGGAFVFVERHDVLSLFLAYCDAGRGVKMRFRPRPV